MEKRKSVLTIGAYNTHYFHKFEVTLIKKFVEKFIKIREFFISSGISNIVNDNLSLASNVKA